MPTNTPSAPLVSVIIPVYNRERYIRQAIDSALQQTYRPIELLVIDDGSVDRTAEIVKSFGNRVSYIRRDNSGPAAARNHGIQRSRGAFIAFLDSDDLWPGNKLATQMRHLLDHPEIDYTIGKVEYFLDPGAAIPSGFRKELLEAPRIGRLLQATVARKELFDRIGLFDETLETAEDVDWFCRANDCEVQMAALQEIVVRVRIHSANTALTAGQDNRNLLAALRRSVLRKAGRLTEASGMGEQ